MYRRLSVVLGCSIGLVFVFLLWPSSLTNISAAAIPRSVSAPPDQLIAAGSPVSHTAPDVITSTDDRNNATPTGWWVYSGQSLADISNFVNANNARLVDLAIDSLGSPHRFTATYVPNSGAYAKSWWYYDGVDATQLGAALSANNARPQSVSPHSRASRGSMEHEEVVRPVFGIRLRFRAESDAVGHSLRLQSGGHRDAATSPMNGH